MRISRNTRLHYRRNILLINTTRDLEMLAYYNHTRVAFKLLDIKEKISKKIKKSYYFRQIIYYAL